MHLRLLFQKNLPMKIFKKNQKIYAKTKEVFGNPLMGYAPCAWNESVRKDVTLLYMDITWAELEPVEGQFAWDAIDAEDQVARWQAEGKHILVVAGDIACGEGFGEAENQSAEHGAGNGADAAEHGRGEGLHAGQEADEEVDLSHVRGDEHAADGGQGGTDDEGHGNEMVGIDAEKHGHLAVLGRGAHGLAHAGVADPEHEGEHGDEAHHKDEEVTGAHDIAEVGEELHVGEEIREGDEVGSLGQEDVVLEERGHTDGRDERRQAGSVAQGLVGHLFQRVAVGRRPDDGAEGGDEKDAAGREADVSEDAGEEEGREGADHVDFAVGEVQEADDAVHERVAEGYERVDAAAGEPPEEELDKILKVGEKGAGSSASSRPPFYLRVTL